MSFYRSLRAEIESFRRLRKGAKAHGRVGEVGGFGSQNRGAQQRPSNDAHMQCLVVRTLDLSLSNISKKSSMFCE